MSLAYDRFDSPEVDCPSDSSSDEVLHNGRFRTKLVLWKIELLLKILMSMHR